MGYDHEIFSAPASPHHTCPYCKKVFSEAKSGPCGHVLCDACWITGKDKKKICPICPKDKKGKVDSGSLILDAILNELVGALETYCDHEGCSAIIPLKSRGEHLEFCQHRISKTIVIPELEEVDLDEGEGTKGESKEKSERKRMRLKQWRTYLCAKLVIILVVCVTCSCFKVQEPVGLEKSAEQQQVSDSVAPHSVSTSIEDQTFKHHEIDDRNQQPNHSNQLNQQPDNQSTTPTKPTTPTQPTKPPNQQNQTN